MKKIYSWIAVLIFSAAFAQDQDPKAKKILDELSAKTKAYLTIKADFLFTTESRDNKKESQTGTVFIKGSKYKLEIKGQEIVSDGKTVWTYLKDANEVQVNNVDPNSTETINPSTIFTMYEKGFKYKFDSESGNVETINLYPSVPDKKKYHTVKLMVDKLKKQIVAAKMLMKDGSTYTYTIKTFTPNVEVNDSVFSFDTKAHAGVEVVDLRD